MEGAVVGKSRLEAFSEGVIAIMITIMVPEMKVPHDETVDALVPLLPVFLSYGLSFVYVGTYWNNHHHMLHATGRSLALYCGQTSTCCSGCPCSLSLRAGWATTIWLPCLPRYTDWFCSWRT
jgi:hypothetical protein